MRTHSFCKYGTDGMDGMDGALVGLGWDGRERQNRSATIGWLVTSNKGRMGHKDLMVHWWDRGGTDEH